MRRFGRVTRISVIKGTIITIDQSPISSTAINIDPPGENTGTTITVDTITITLGRVGIVIIITILGRVWIVTIEIVISGLVA